MRSLVAVSARLSLPGRISAFITCCSAFVEGERLADIYQPGLFLDILKLVFAQFRVVARIHEIIIANMQRIKVSSIYVLQTKQV